MYVMHGAEAACGAAAGGLGRSRWCGLRGESHGGFCAGGFCEAGFCEAGCGEAGWGEGGCGEGGWGEAGWCEGGWGERGLRKCPTVTLPPRGRRAPLPWVRAVLGCAGARRGALGPHLHQAAGGRPAATASWRWKGRAHAAEAVTCPTAREPCGLAPER